MVSFILPRTLFCYVFSGNCFPTFSLFFINQLYEILGFEFIIYSENMKLWKQDDIFIVKFEALHLEMWFYFMVPLAFSGSSFKLRFHTVFH